MRSGAKQDEQITYRLILVRADTNTVLIRPKEEGGILPFLQTCRYNRRAQQLQLEVRQAWGMDSVVLDLRHGEDPYAILEIISAYSSTQFREVTLSNLTNMVREGWERDLLFDFINWSRCTRNSLTRPGWLREALAWLRTEVGGTDFSVRDIRQFNGGSGFALLRCELTDRRVFWLKATGEPNRHEFGVVRALTQICPQSQPRVVAFRPDWNAWWMEDAGEPAGVLDRAHLEQAIIALATLQIRTIGHDQTLLEAGAIDCRLFQLRSRIPATVAYLAAAMQKQQSTRVPRLAPKRLEELGRMLHIACLNLEELEIPDALLHGDTKSDNILYRREGCVFTDWSEACIGNPFLGFHYLSLLVRGQELLIRLKQIYASNWRGILSAAQIERAFILTPIVAAFRHLYGRGDWLNSTPGEDPAFEGYARSLARHIDRAAHAPELVEVLCR